MNTASILNNNDNTLNYLKRKNSELFKTLENSDILFLSKTQNYIPIYNRFFSLNNSNYNNINLNHTWYLHNIKTSIDTDSDTKKIFQCRIKNIENDEIKNKTIFIKLAPLLDPFKFLVGKYNNISDDTLYNLPNVDNDNCNCHTKLLDMNNSAYVDGLFVYLTSILKNNHKFYHGLEYYGSFLSIKNNFVINVFDDLEYLSNSEFFNKNKNILFKIDQYDHLIQNEKQTLQPITIDYTSTAKSYLSLNSINNEIFDNLFNDSYKKTEESIESSEDNIVEHTIIDIDCNNTTTLKSNSNCSSRLSYTNSDISENDLYDTPAENKSITESFDKKMCQGKKNIFDGGNNCNKNNNLSDLNDDDDEDDSHDDDDDDDDEDDEDDEDDSDSTDYEEEEINVTINKFPVQVICMENCETTLDDLIMNNKLSNNEWFSALMQIIMILITYQKAFSFTHNDLHTNNIMYNETTKKFITYYYNKKTYKVPTFGRIFKIIDFGRSIYKYQGKIFCSDSFQTGNDAASQYNTEPYFDEKKPRLEPNFSFDLTRLACSIFDYLVDDLEEIQNLDEITDPVKKIIVEWCLDDKGTNLLYKNNGDERYPDFKLYKMIARHVHNHIPQAQLERPEFKQFIIEEKEEKKEAADFHKNQNIIKINIDKIPSLI